MTAATVTLDHVPAMGAAFARAMVPTHRAAARLPEATVELLDQRQDPERLAAYSRVCGFTLKDAVPPTWLHVLTFPLHVHLLGAHDSTVRLVGAVHVSNEMTMHRPVRADERLTIRVHADRLRPHAKGALVDLVGEVSVDGETVWEGISTYLAHGAHTPGLPEALPRLPFSPAEPHGRWRLGPGLGRAYRGVSHDPNPIHTSKVLARAFGFPRPVIHGMWTHAHALATLEARLPASYRVSAGFARPIYLPGTVGFRTEHHDAGTDVIVTTRDGAKPHMIMRVTP
ncbi:MaoC/PaaZ C-terminal domain-containing protein [Demequina salsinemoris]|uniref:MaoC/PaaZ C-terminal domain-containing protein n=1 Tax=Demequina salsinemoris TaxID=577470 RepID=UPI000781A05E|nr:MaoC/PaaZ C-terminal domain-containing protein [Demequina salsinemoris]